MRRLMTCGLLLLGTMLLSTTLVGCNCCGARPIPDAPIVQVPPQEPMPYQPPTPAPIEPAPLVIPEPAPAPVVVTPPPPAPKPMTVEVPSTVAKAIEDLGTKYPGLFTFDRSRGLFLFNSDITFDSGSAVVKQRARNAIMTLADILNGDQAKDRVMTIIGYTDSYPVRKARTVAHLKALGKSANNRGLSEARAEAVAGVLSAGGVAKTRMVTKGKGTANPVASNRTASGRASNRRVEIYLTPMAR